MISMVLFDISGMYLLMLKFECLIVMCFKKLIEGFLFIGFVVVLKKWVCNMMGLVMLCSVSVLVIFVLLFIVFMLVDLNVVVGNLVVLS